MELGYNSVIGWKCKVLTRRKKKFWWGFSSKTLRNFRYLFCSFVVIYKHRKKSQREKITLY